MTAILQHELFVPMAVMAAVIALFPLAAGYIVLVERKVLADLQTRLGPMRVGPHGLLQPLADALKLLLKEDLIPRDADRFIFWLAPIVATFTALACFALVPFSDWLYVADVNVGLLVIVAIGSVGVYGFILGGWASNSHYSLLGGLRSSAQLVSYEIALSFALLSGLMAAGTLSMQSIVSAQQAGGIWFAFGNYGLLFIAFIVYFIAATAETNRIPFDLPEAESELVGGFHTEYSGLRWGFYMLAEYANVFVVSSVAVTLFWGGWLRPFPSVALLEIPLNIGVPAIVFFGTAAGCVYLTRKLRQPVQRVVLLAVAAIVALLGVPFLVPQVNPKLVGIFWFLGKVCVFLYIQIWFRGTFPRFRYDQLMNVGWKVLVPLGMVLVAANALVGLI